MSMKLNRKLERDNRLYFYLSDEELLSLMTGLRCIALAIAVPLFVTRY